MLFVKNVLKGSAKKKRKFVKTGDVQNYDPSKDNNISTNVFRMCSSAVSRRRGCSDSRTKKYDPPRNKPFSGTI